MPPKAKDKKGKQEVLPVGIDYTRRPLASAEPCDARPPPRRELPVVSAHHAFEEWDDDALLEMEWGMVRAEPFEDKDGRSFLPARISARVARWVRPTELLTNETGEDGKEEHQQHSSGAVGGNGTASGVEKGKAGGGADKGKGKSPKGKDKGPSVEPVVLEDVAVDLQGNPLPRIFVPRAAIVANDSATDEGAQTLSQVAKQSSVPNATLPRGFKTGWSESQRRDIASLLCKYNQQQHQQQEHLPPETSGDAAATITEKETPPEAAVERHHREEEGTSGDWSKEPPAYLRDEDIATLGAPSGGDIDPAMTAIFKAIDQLSSTVSSTGCPLLWETIYPKTANEVPCYNPCGRYLIKLFAAGRWRRVEVDDSIPLDATGRPVRSFSCTQACGLQEIHHYC
ncbi:hypothetical protein Esi_0004_0215 [Ectocarpus siliculosus]|uniref:Calpain catalytic domain-containing protein n=1 Tax=Ectocarpus siliculosus TaxID=2880 RepID=D8LMH7_ECTSI|nr:hypothetical protein Esi_0004_0215 [Ectocarpus siliculosus]|eukprot:CBN77587.1 hypothetical protein Esi_0004_0215 [Ectocarpus siliculosus]